MKDKYLMKIYGFALMILLGIVYSYSVFRLNLEDEYGISTIYSGFPYMFKLLFFSVSMGFSGYLFKKLGTKKVALLGSVFVVIGFIISYFAQFAETGNLILIMTIGYGLFIGLGIGPLYMLPLRVLSSNLDKNVGLWTGVTLFGIGISPMVFSPAVTYLFDYFTIFQVFLILGIAYGVLLPLITFNLASMDKTKNNVESKSKSILTNLNFYVVYILFFVIMFIGLEFIGLSANLGVHVFGIEVHIMAIFIGLFSIFNGLRRPIAGWVVDRLSIFKTSIISMVSILIMMSICLWKIDSQVLFLVGIGVVYLNFGAWLLIAPISTRRLFGSEHYSKNYGYMFSAYGISAFIGTWLSSSILEEVGLNGLYVMAIGMLTFGIIISVIFRKILSI